MRALRFGAVWLSLGWVLLAAIVLTSLLPMPGEMPAGDKPLHFAVYWLLALWFGSVYRREFHGRIGGLLVCFGFLIECLQAATGYRSFEWADLLADALGVGLGLLMVATPLGDWLQWAERWLPGHA
jgi:VanZ family protein